MIKNKIISMKGNLIGFVAITPLLIAMIFSSGAKAIGNNTPDGGRVAGLCYNANNTQYQLISSQSEIDACTQQGFQVVNVGQPVPTAVCVTNQSAQTMTPTSSREACTAAGGAALEASQPLTAIVIPPSGGAAGGGSDGSGKNAGENVSERRARSTCHDAPTTADNCPFLKRYIIPAINALSAAVGIVVVIMIVWGGIRYSSARDNPQQAAQAKEHVRNALVALVMYIFMVAFLNWVVPGGLF